MSGAGRPRGRVLGPDGPDGSHPRFWDDKAPPEGNFLGPDVSHPGVWDDKAPLEGNVLGPKVRPDDVWDDCLPGANR